MMYYYKLITCSYPSIIAFKSEVALFNPNKILSLALKIGKIKKIELGYQAFRINKTEYFNVKKNNLQLAFDLLNEDI